MSLRELVIPDPGKSFVQIDQAGADALIVSMLCNHNSNYRALFNNNIKPHVYTALAMFQGKWDKESPGLSATDALKIPINLLNTVSGWPELRDYVKNSKTEYYIGKKVGHSCNYGEQANTLIGDILNETDGKLILTRNQGEEYITAYHRLFPEIQRDFQAYVKSSLQKNRTLRNLFGYPITFIGVWNDDLFRKAYAWLPQSTVAIITALAITEIHERLLARDPLLNGVDLLQDGHDSILLQSPSDNVAAVAHEIQKHINRQMINPNGETFTMKSEINYSDKNWKNMIPI